MKLSAPQKDPEVYFGWVNHAKFLRGVFVHLAGPIPEYTNRQEKFEDIVMRATHGDPTLEVKQLVEAINSLQQYPQ